MNILQKYVQTQSHLHRNRAEIREATSKKKKNDWFRGDGKYNSVLFVPATPGSVLANSIRKLEEANHQGRTLRVKIVEKTGFTLKSSLTNKTPWGTNNC